MLIPAEYFGCIAKMNITSPYYTLEQLQDITMSPILGMHRQDHEWAVNGLH
jgi:hypothetical protein